MLWFLLADLGCSLCYAALVGAFSYSRSCVSGLLVYVAAVVFSWVESALVAVSSSNIRDTGFLLTARAYDYLLANPSFAEWACFTVNAAYVVLIAYAAVRVVQLQQYGLFAIGLSCMGARVFVASLTALPISKEFLPSVYDVPPTSLQLFGDDVVTAPNGSLYSPFITFYSGHTALVTVFCTFARRHLSYRAFRNGVIFAVTQALYMLASRGHYTIDMAAALVIGRWAANYIGHANCVLHATPLIGRALYTVPPRVDGALTVPHVYPERNLPVAEPAAVSRPAPDVHS